MSTIRIRPATSAELVGVRNVLDGAALCVERSLSDAIAEQAVFVAVSERETVLGAVVLAGREITAIAVRPGRRGQGIGTGLVDAAEHGIKSGDAGGNRRSLVAEFDAGVADFWKHVGFTCEEIDPGRFRGERSASKRVHEEQNGSERVHEERTS